MTKVAILAGGVGTRLAEETEVRPKPMVEIGGRPILWHIMMHYHGYGHREFVIALGYKGDFIKKYFADYRSLNSNLTVKPKSGEVRPHDANLPDWTVDLIDTGNDTLTGGRIKRLGPYLAGETFMLTWGDGVANVDLDRLMAFHRAHGKLATVTAVRPPARFGGLAIEGDTVREFSEKPQTGEGWINGGFFVFEPGVFDYLSDDDAVLEREPLEQLAAEGELMAYRHEAFWQPMDTIREKQLLESLWTRGDAPWKTWERTSGNSGGSSSPEARVYSVRR
jgi:glucose-1-phosphate cytidylyltransferase